MEVLDNIPVLGLSWWLIWKRTCLQCRRSRFDPWVRKIPWRREWQPTPVLLPGEFHGQRNLAGYSPWGRRALDLTEQLTLSLFFTFMEITQRREAGYFFNNRVDPAYKSLLPFPCTSASYLFASTCVSLPEASSDHLYHHHLHPQIQQSRSTSGYIAREIYVSQFWRLEVDQGASRVDSRWGLSSGCRWPPCHFSHTQQGERGRQRGRERPSSLLLL